MAARLSALRIVLASPQQYLLALISVGGSKPQGLLLWEELGKLIKFIDLIGS
jgi:hypothetical protein